MPDQQDTRPSTQHSPGVLDFFSQKRRAGKSSSLVIGGGLGLISLLVILLLSFKPILFVRGGPSATPTLSSTSLPSTMRQNIPSTPPTHLDQSVQKWAFRAGGAVCSSPRVENGVLYVGAWDSSVYAIDARTGQKIWAFPIGHNVDSSPTAIDVYSVCSSPMVESGVLYVGSLDHNVYVIDARTGQKIWAFPTGGRVLSSPTIESGILYVGSWDSSVYALDARTGQRKWACPTGGSVWSSPTIESGVLYIGSDDSNIYALTLPA